MNVQALSIENPAISPMHSTGRHVLLAVTLVIVTFSMFLCLCIFFAYSTPLLFMAHLFASITSLPVTSISVLTFCITGGAAIILWVALFFCAEQDRVARASNDIPLSPAFFSTASPAPMQQRTCALFSPQLVAPATPTSHYGNQASWEANITHKMEERQYAIRMRQHAREMRLQTYAPSTDSKSKAYEYQMKRAGTRNFYKKNQQDSSLNKHTGGKNPGTFDEIYWWSIMSSEQGQGLRTTEGMEKIVTRNNVPGSTSCLNVWSQ